MKGKFDIKKFGVAHGEKIVLGVAGVLALFVLMKTTWGQYTKLHPKQMADTAKEAKETISRSQWPQAEADKYSPDDVLGIKVASMLTPIPGDRLIDGKKTGFAFELLVSPPLYVREKPLTEPKLYPVQYLVATHFRPVIAKKSETAFVDDESDPDDPMGIANGGQPKVARGKFKVPSRRGGDMGTGPGGMPMGGGHGGPAAGGPKSKKTSKGAGGHGGPAAPGPMDVEGAGGGYGTEGGELVEADGRRAIAVRGLFPILLQMRAYEKALNLPEGYDPQTYIDIKDFVLERCSSSDGGKTFGKWTEVDKKANIEYLKTKVADFETDIVPQGVTHFRITSPLPMRLLRSWGDEATHPRLDPKKYLLTPEGRRRQKLINQAVKEVRDYNKQVTQASSGGFGDVQVNMNGQRNEMMGNSSYQQQFTRKISGYEAGDMGDVNNPGQRQGLLDTYKNEANAAGDLILFRYFDFDVLPGSTYKYRVRLKIRNPLFEQPVEKLAQAARDSNKKEFRDTRLSNETKPVTVPQDVDLFVNSVTDRRSLRMLNPTVTMLLYQWMPDLGTVVKGRVQDVQVGQTLAGKDTKTERLDPAKEILLFNAESEFSTGSVVLDLRTGHRKLDDRHFKELGLPRSLKGKLASPDEVILVDERGHLQTIDQAATAFRKSVVDKAWKTMMTAFEELRTDAEELNKQTEAGDDAEAGTDIDNPIDDDERGTRRRRRGRRSRGSSPLRYPSGYGPNSGSGPMGSGRGRYRGMR